MNYLDELKTIIQEDGSQIVVRQGDDKYASFPEMQSNEPAFFENWTYVVECYKVCQINYYYYFIFSSSFALILL